MCKVPVGVRTQWYFIWHLLQSFRTDTCRHTQRHASWMTGPDSFGHSWCGESCFFQFKSSIYGWTRPAVKRCYSPCSLWTLSLSLSPFISIVYLLLLLSLKHITPPCSRLPLFQTYQHTHRDTLLLFTINVCMQRVESICLSRVHIDFTQRPANAREQNQSSVLQL